MAGIRLKQKLQKRLRSSGMNKNNVLTPVLLVIMLIWPAVHVMSTPAENKEKLHVTVRQITFGPKNHFFGYIGYALTIPWNAGGRYIVALESDFFDRMPEKGEYANIVLVDTRNDNKVIILDKTLAWNLQQGTMLNWNPENPETQFFFNDLDPASGVVFTVLYDIMERRRIKEYRYGNQSIANGGINPRGQWFCGTNYGRLSTARKVISYAGATDWTLGEKSSNPDDDGLFRIDIATGERELLVSFRTLAEFFNVENADSYPLNVHYIIWNRDGDRIFFLLRGNGKGFLPNIGCVINADGTGLRQVPFTGHREWAEGKNLVIPGKNGFDLYNVDQNKIVGTIGNNDIFMDTWEDNIMSPDGIIYVGSYNPDDDSCIYSLMRIDDGAFVRSPAIKTQRKPKNNDCRIDPAPCWNRNSDAILIPGIAADGTRQMFVIQLSM
jgi:hypothetical protein